MDHPFPLRLKQLQVREASSAGSPRKLAAAVLADLLAIDIVTATRWVTTISGAHTTSPRAHRNPAFGVLD